MKQKAIRHPKTERFMRHAGIGRAEAVGILEMLWHWAGDYALDGEITDLESDIEAGLEWSGEPGKLVPALVLAGWVDQHDGRLFIHDWAEHCPDYIRKRMAAAGIQRPNVPQEDARGVCLENGGERQPSATDGGKRRKVAEEICLSNPIQSNPTQSKPIEKKTRDARASPCVSGRFVRPTVEQVRAYCQERANAVDPEAFVDFYEAKGWVVGKSPMKSWQAAVRTWERSSHERRAPAPGRAPRPDKRAGEFDEPGLKL